MFWKFWNRPKETPEERIARLKKQERPEVYVSSRGTLYVKADELLYSKQGHKAVKEVEELFYRAIKKPGSSQEEKA